MGLSISAESQSFRLSEGAMLCLQAMALPPAQEAIVANCVSRYSIASINTFSDMLSWLIFRISNAFYAVIGKETDWDVVKKIVLANSLETAIQRGIILRNPQTETEVLLKNASVEFFKSVSPKHLDLCIRAQDNQSTASDELRRGLEGVNLEHQMNRIQDIVVRARQRTQ